jgi:transcription termination/antitermination protein NusA
VDEDEKSALVIVSDTQLSLAIGKKGQNVRLAAKLTGWKIDIYSETEYDKMTVKDREKEIEEAIARESKLLEEAQAALPEEAQAALPEEAQAELPEEAQAAPPKVEDIPGLTGKTAEKLKEAGLDDLEKLSRISLEELTALEGIGEKTAKKIVDGAKGLLGQ